MWEGGEGPKSEENIHEQKDETILGVAVFGKNDRKWAAAWVNHLLEGNPTLKNLRVLFRIKEEKKEVTVPVSTDLDKSAASEAKPHESQ